MNNTKLAIAEVIRLSELKQVQTGVIAFVGSTLVTESSGISIELTKEK